MPEHLEKIALDALNEIHSVSLYLRDDKGNVWIRTSPTLEKCSADKLGDNAKSLSQKAVATAHLYKLVSKFIVDICASADCGTGSDFLGNIPFARYSTNRNLERPICHPS
jgi:hypothetical protein